MCKGFCHNCSILFSMGHGCFPLQLERPFQDGMAFSWVKRVKRHDEQLLYASFEQFKEKVIEDHFKMRSLLIKGWNTFSFVIFFFYIDKYRIIILKEGSKKTTRSIQEVYTRSPKNKKHKEAYTHQPSIRAQPIYKMN